MGGNSGIVPSPDRRRCMCFDPPSSGWDIASRLQRIKPAVTRPQISTALATLKISIRFDRSIVGLASPPSFAPGHRRPLVSRHVGGRRPIRPTISAAILAMELPPMARQLMVTRLGESTRSMKSRFDGGRIGEL